MKITPAYTQREINEHRIKYSSIRQHADGIGSREVIDKNFIYVCGGNFKEYVFTIYTKENKKWVGYFTLNFMQGSSLLPALKLGTVAHPHFLINPEFQGRGYYH